MAKRSYKNPPIHEALVEFRFEKGQEWDLTIPGKLHDRIKKYYDGKSRQQQIIEAAVSAPQAQESSFNIRSGVVRVQLPNKDGTRLVAVGPNSLSINTLRPYDGWKKFLPRIRRAFQAYQDVAGPQEVVRIGVRYINRIEIHESDADPTSYLPYSIHKPDKINARMANFGSRLEFLRSDGVKMLITQASQTAALNSSIFLLDLDVIWEKETLGSSYDKTMEMVKKLHEYEGATFESLITDKARKLFDAD